MFKYSAEYGTQNQGIEVAFQNNILSLQDRCLMQRLWTLWGWDYSFLLFILYRIERDYAPYLKSQIIIIMR